MRSSHAILLTAGVLAGALSPGVAALAEEARGRVSEQPAGTGQGVRRASAAARQAIAAFEAHLDRAVDRVSVPHSFRLLGRDAARGYRLPGYGMVFFLMPRALPNGRDVLLRFSPGGSVRMQTRPATPAGAGLPEEVESLEHRVIILQHETEQTRRAAEQDMERIVHDVRVRLRAPDDAPAPEDPVAPEMPTSPQVVQPAQPPWKFWFDARTARDERTPQAMMSEVREALIVAFETPAARLPGLGPDEFVTVAVDFSPVGFFSAEAVPERTLILRGRVADIEARVRGAMEPSEFRRRLEVIEY